MIGASPIGYRAGMPAAWFHVESMPAVDSAALLDAKEAKHAVLEAKAASVHQHATEAAEGPVGSEKMVSSFKASSGKKLKSGTPLSSVDSAAVAEAVSAAARVAARPDSAEAVAAQAAGFQTCRCSVLAAVGAAVLEAHPRNRTIVQMALAAAGWHAVC